MKTSIVHLLGLFLLLSFAAACGKGGEGGGSSKNPNYASNNLTGNSSTYLKELQTWYKTNSSYGTFPIPTLSQQYPGLNAFKEVRKSRTWQGCNQEPVKIFGINLGNVQFCNNSTPSSTTVSDKVITGVNANVAKSSYPKLVAIMNGSQGSISNVAKFNGLFARPAYIVDMVKADGTYTKVVIDTGVHPAFNPVSTFNYQTKVEEYVHEINLPF